MSAFLVEAIVFLLGAVFIVYFLYFVMVLDTNKKNEYLDKISKILATQIDFQKLPSVSVLVPAYNEEETIYNKLKNISEFDYSKERIEVLVLDDCSTDNTQEMAKKGFEEFALRGKILRNETRVGVNASYNKGMAEANFEYVLTTDADAEIPRDTLRMAAKILMHLGDVGGVAAKMIPVSNENTVATKIESAYRGFYDSMLTAESAIFSTFPGSTSCALIRKSAFSPISSQYGSSDGNISLSIIKSGSRFIYVPNIVYYEPVSQEINEQRRQKIRRAARLIQSTLMNWNMFFNRKYKVFGKFIFPLRFLMHVLCPVLMVCAFALILVFAYSLSLTLLILVLAFSGIILLLGSKANVSVLNLITSFLMHQIYLCLGFFLSFRRMDVWKRIERRSFESK